ncbi:hypothetical protein FACS1894145_4260 [Bacteroidia bacterium]|nr:hypothetical protein FACS1894145_4260 [Bacteroidia bacterium]
METTVSLKKNSNNAAISGRYELPDKRDKISELRQELEMGEQSRTIDFFDSPHYLQKLHEKYL